MVFKATATLVGKGLKKGAKKLKELERGASTRAGAAGNKGVRIEKNANVGQGYGVTDTTKGAQALTKAERAKLTSTGRKRIAGGAGVAAGTGAAYSLFKDDKKKDEKSAKADKKETEPTGRFGQGSSKTRNGKANVSKEQLEKTGLTLTAYMNKWNKSGKRPTAAAADSKSSTKKSSSKNRPAIFGKDAKFRPLGGVLARALLGDDEKFGGERGLIDFVRIKKKKPVKKKLGGMTMKAKGYSRGGTVARSKPGNELPMVGKKPPMSRAQSRATLSPAQRRLLDSVQGREGSKQSTSVIQDLSDKYGYAPGKRAGAKGGMGKGKRAKPPGMQRGGVAVKTTGMGGKEAGTSKARSGAGTGRSISQLSDAQKNLLRSVQSTGRKQPTSVIDELTKKYGNLAARKQRQTLKAKAPKPPGMNIGGAVGMAGPKGGLQPAAGKRPSTMRSGPREEKLAAAKKAMAMRGAAGRRSGGSTPRGMKAGGMSMKSKMASKGGKMGGMMPPGYKKGGSVGRKKARGVGAAKRGFGRAMR